MAAPYYGGGPAPPPAAAPAPVAVVSPQFCAPYVVPLTVTKKAISLSDGDFTVTDANGAVVLRVKGAIFSVRHRRVLLDAAGQPILSMQEKVIISFTDRIGHSFVFSFPLLVSICGLFWIHKDRRLTPTVNEISYPGNSVTKS
jgi:hypothetical protein